jgi:hypothetical protein
MRPVAVDAGDEQRAGEALRNRRRTVFLRNTGVIALVVLVLAAIPLALSTNHGTRVRTERGTAGQPSGGAQQLQLSPTTQPTEAAPGAAQQQSTGRASAPTAGSASGNGATPGPVPSGSYVRINSHGLVTSRYDGSDERELAPAGWFALSPDRSHVLWSSCESACPLRNIDVRSGAFVTLDDGDHGVWSRDGSWVQYTKMVTPQPNVLGQAPTPELWAVPTAGGHANKVVAGSSGVWSPDATQVAYEAKDGVHTVNRDGTGDRATSSQGGTLWGWSPDGSQLVVRISQTSDNWTDHLVVVDVASGTSRDLGTWAPLSWLPDGRSVLALQTYGALGRGGYIEPMPLAVLQLGDGSVRRVADVAGGGAVSPDGASIAYATGKPNSTWDTVHVVSMGGSGDRVLGSSGGWDVSTEWSADNSAVVWSYYEGVRHGEGAAGPHHTVVQRVDGRGTWHLDG